MIIASPPIIAKWREEAADALTAANRVSDPALLDTLVGAPRDVVELVITLSSALARVSGVLGATAERAVPSALEALEAGLANLAREVHAQESGEEAGEPGYVCPLPTLDGGAFRCGCPVADRCDPALAYACGLNPPAVGASPNTQYVDAEFREVRHDRLDADLEQVVEDDRTARGEDGPR